ncbi:MAG: glycosyltransferase [Cytophagaceae bacterium]|nr:glycosyltransferase [Cytophagaceae bacterium]
MIGDVLTSSILFEALRKEYPTAQLDYLIQPHTLPVVEHNPYIDHVILDRQDASGNAISLLAFAKRIQAENYDAIIDIYSKIGTAIVTSRSGAKYRIGYKKWYTKLAYSHTFSYGEEATTRAGLAIENRLKVLEPLSSNFPLALKPKIYLRPDEIEAARSFLTEKGVTGNQKPIMISLLGSSSSKTYPLKYMKEIVETAAQAIDAPLLLNYIPKQKAQVDEFLSMCDEETQKKIRGDIYAKSLRAFLGILSQCRAIVGNEGGAINMAKALDIPTFAIYAPTTRRKSWDSYPGPKQVAVHLNDYAPALFEDKNKKEIRAENDELYSHFTPDLIMPELTEFFKNIY